MDFNKFQEWCQNKGFVIKLPSGYVKLINLDVSSFESFKGIFNLCMIFFYEETNRIKNEEMKECLKNLDNQPIALYSSDDEGVSTLERIYDHDKVNKNKRVYSSEIKFENGSSITPLKEGNIVRSLRSNKYWGNIDPKYTDEDFEKAINYLLTPNSEGIVPMDELLNSLTMPVKINSKSKWCDLGKEDYLKELENS